MNTFLRWLIQRIHHRDTEAQRRKNLCVSASLWFICAAILSGCARAPQPVGVLRVAQESDPATLDPARAYDTTSIAFVRVMYRGLVEYDFDAHIQPEVAKSYSISPDGKTYRFQLRPDVRFWDKTPVLSTDFRCALERALDPATASDGSSFFTGILGAKEWGAARGSKQPIPHVAGIVCPSPDALEIRLTQPDATFLSRLTLPFAYAVPEHYIQKLRAKVGGDGKALSDEFSQHPLGDGPFMLADWIHDASLKMVRNPDYFRQGFPRANELDAQLGLSTPLQTMLFEQGALDVQPISDAFAPDFLRLTHSEKWKPYIESAPMMDIRYMAMNTEVAPFKDKRVRQAVCYAINRDRIVSFLTGRATKARGALPEGVPGYDAKLFSYPYDPAKARQLLKAANYKSGPLPLLYSTNEPWYAKAAQSIQQDLAAVGITVEPKGMRYGDLKAIAGTRGEKGGRFVIQGWVQDFPDPSNYLDPLFNGKSITPSASLNRSFYSNPKVNALLDSALQTPNGPVRWRKYEEAQRQIVDDAPVVFLHNTERYVARQPRIGGFRLHPAWTATYEFLSAK